MNFKASWTLRGSVANGVPVSARLTPEVSAQQLLELGAHIALENYRARFNRLFDVGSDNLYAPSTSGKDNQPDQPST